LAIGFHTSGTTNAVKNRLQPPLSGGSFLALRPTSVCQSIACTSTLKPACRSSCAPTSGSLLIVLMSVGLMMTTVLPSYPEDLSSSCAFFRFDFCWMSVPARFAYAVPHTNIEGQVL